MSKVVGNVAYIIFVIILLYYIWLVSYSQYLNTDANSNFEAAQSTIISYTHKK